MALRYTDIVGTLRNTFRIGPKTAPATITAASLTTARTFTLPDVAGTIALGLLKGYTFVRKTADESVTSSAALQDDDHLFFSIAANETWIADFVLLYDGATGGDMSACFNVPSGATGFHTGLLPIETASGFSGDLQWGATTDLTDTGFRNLGCIGAGSLIHAVMKVQVVNSSNAGTVKLRWAQRASSGTATRIFTGSYLEARRVA